jgi:hypothetical protein
MSTSPASPVSAMSRTWDWKYKERVKGKERGRERVRESKRVRKRESREERSYNVDEKLRTRTV